MQPNIIDLDIGLPDDLAITQAIEQAHIFARHSALISTPSVLIINIGCRPLLRHQLESLLTDLVKIANPTAIIVANIDNPGWDTLLMIADSIERKLTRTDERPTSSSPTASPNAVLAVMQDGQSMWTGMPSVCCGILNSLLTHGPVPVDRVRPMNSSSPVSEAVLRDLLEQWHVVEITHDRHLRLRFSLLDIVSALEEHASVILADALRTATRPVLYRDSDTVFLTPSGRTVSAYVCVDELLSDALSRQVLGILSLRLHMTLQVRARHNPPITIVTDERRASGLADALRDHLGAAEVVPLPPFAAQTRPEVPIAIDPHNTIVIFTDLISTGSLVTTLGERLLQQNLRPSIIATIIDGRETISDEMTLAGLSIPVISLATMNLTPDELQQSSAHVIRINPVTRRPELQHAEPRYPIAPTVLDDMLKRSSAIYFDHLTRASWRHFTLFVDGLQLLGAAGNPESPSLSALGEFICSAFVEAIQSWCRDTGIEEIDALLYPASLEDEGPAPGPAARIARQVGKTLGLPAERVRELARRSGSTEFLFADAVAGDWAEGPRLAGITNSDSEQLDTVVVLDWGCITGQTARELLLAAEALRASKALLLIFLSQLPEREELYFRKTRSVGDPVAPTEVTVRFITKCGTWGYTKAECPWCEQLRRFHAELQKLNPPELLRDFVTGAEAEFAPKTLKEIRRRAAAASTRRESMAGAGADPTGVPDSIVRMARFRELLREGEAKTLEREVVRAQIQALLDDRTPPLPERQPTRADLLSLLGTEWTLLERAPLARPDMRADIARLAAAAMRDPTVDEPVRQHALVVLRTTSPEILIKQLRDVLPVSLTLQRFTTQFLYCAFTLLKAETQIDIKQLSSLVESLGIAANRLRASIGPTGTDFQLRVLATVNFMHDIGTHLLTTSALTAEPIKPLDAWRQLRVEFGEAYGPHNDICRRYRRLFLPTLEHALQTGAPSLPPVPWNRIATDWEWGERRLYEHVLRYLPSVQPILTGYYARRYLGTDEVRVLADPMQRDLLRLLSGIRTWLQAFVKRPGHVQQPGVWGEFVEARNTIWDLLLSYRSDEAPPSTLLQILDGCPLPLADLDLLLAELQPEYPALTMERTTTLAALAGEGTRVFCHRQVLLDLFRELFDNASRYGAAPISVQIDAWRNEDRIAIAIRNTRSDLESEANSRQPQRRGQGLMDCQEWLADYGGTLSPVSPDRPWTFDVRITLLEA